MEKPKSTDAAAVRGKIVDIAYAYGGKATPGVLRAMVNSNTGRLSSIWLLEDGTYLLVVGGGMAMLHPDGSMSDGFEEIFAAIEEDHLAIETFQNRWRQFFARIAQDALGDK